MIIFLIIIKLSFQLLGLLLNNHFQWIRRNKHISHLIDRFRGHYRSKAASFSNKFEGQDMSPCNSPWLILCSWLFKRHWKLEPDYLKCRFATRLFHSNENLFNIFHLKGSSLINGRLLIRRFKFQLIPWNSQMCSN